MNTTSSIPRSGEVTSDAIKERHGVLLSLQGDMLIAVEQCRTEPGRFKGCVRGDITEFSLGSIMRMRRYLRSATAGYHVFITLTYPFSYPSNGKVVKEHLRRFNQELCRETRRSRGSVEGFSLFWFLEFQNRGAPHFHLFCTHEVSKKWLSETWYRIVGSEDIRHLHAGTNIQTIRGGRGATVAYAAKYAAKSNQKEIPGEYANVGRFWGISGLRAVREAAIFISDASRENKMISAAYERLVSEIRELTEGKQAVTIVKKEGVRVKLLRDMSQRNRISVLIELLASRIAANRMDGGMFDRFAGAELEDIDTSTGQLVRCGERRQA